MAAEAHGMVRDIPRLYELAGILVKHGFGELAQRMGLLGLLEQAGRTLHLRDTVGGDLSAARRVRIALEEMGPCFVKLGQLLSTRVDLFPPDWIAQFEQLQDHAAPVGFEAIVSQLRAALGADPGTVFAQLDAVPLAAGSIAQVHRARLHDGRAVAVKVRRPGIESTIDADLRLLGRLAAHLQQESASLARYQPRALVRQFEKSLRRELDLRMECRNAERIAASLANQPDIVVPAIHWQWTSSPVNVQDLVEGIPGSDMDAVDAAGLDRAELARRGARGVLQMVLQDGFFHADPHPGNVFYLAGNRIALIDFGMVGRLTPQRREQLARLLHDLARRDARGAAELLADWSEDGIADVQALEDDLDAFIDDFHGLPLAQIEVGRVLGDFTALMREHGLVLPADLALLLKAALSLEGLGRMLDPGFDMVAEARPYLESLVRNEHSPQKLAQVGAASLREAAALALQLPYDLRRLLKLGERGGITLHIDVSHFDRAWERMDRSVSRLTLGIVTAALIVGSSIVATARAESSWLGLPLLGLLGFLGALGGGVWLLVSIFRSGRHE